MSAYPEGHKRGARGAQTPGLLAHDQQGAACTTRLPAGMTPAHVARLYRELMRDKSYQDYELGRDAAAYLRAKRKVITPATHRDYEAVLDKFARYHPDLALADFEPPVGTERLEEFLEHQWGKCAPRTYNKALSILRDFFKHHILRDNLHGDPTLAIERAKKHDVYRTTFNSSQVRGIIASQPELRDRIALRLLLVYGLRKGALKAARFEHFDHQRKRLTIFTKGGKIRKLPIPDSHFWMDLERHILDIEAQPGWYLVNRISSRPNRRPGAEPFIVEYHDQPMADHGLHAWWYRCLHRAGIVPEGVTNGERMHKARHTAGQRVLDHTGNLKAVQKLLGHASIQTTGDVYADWDIDQLAATMEIVLEAEQEDDQ
jgi:site-specific recombinase XerD